MGVSLLATPGSELGLAAEGLKGLGGELDKYLFVSKKRAIIWGVLAGVAYSASMETDKQIQILENNISKIDAIMKASQAAAPVVYLEKMLNFIFPEVEAATKGYTFVDSNKPVKVTLDCVTGSDPAHCPSFLKQVNALPVAPMPKFMNDQMASIIKLTDSLNGASLVTPAQLASVDALANNQKILSNELTKFTKGDTDFLEGSAKIQVSMNSALRKALVATKMSQEGLTATLSGLRPTSSAAVATDANKNTQGATQVSIVPNSIKNNPGIVVAEVKEFKPEAAAKTEVVAEANKTYKLNQGTDINSDKGSSIFELISNRYQRFMERLSQ
jgi:hypothetical protein